MQNNKLLFLFVMCYFGLYTQVSKAQVSESDSLELVNFYYATGGDNWNDNSGWLVEPVSEWNGITLTDDGSAVKEIQFIISVNGNNLVGEIPNLNLPSLTKLDLARNELIGEIPNFSNLINLKQLYLQQNSLTGNIPDFSNLPNLIRLDIRINDLTGSIPNFSNLPNLTQLDIDHNNLTGSMPNFNNLPKLRHLDISHNNLTGNIPDFSNMPDLELLFINHNNFIGTIIDFNSLPKLRNLDISYNNFTGNILDFTNVPNLTNLYLNNNNLTGNIPDFSNMPNLINLYLNNNNLTGNIPNFSNMPNLITLNLSYNGLTGNIPDFSNMPNLGLYLGILYRGLVLSFNDLTGDIPDFSNMPNLTNIDINNNNLTGNIPDFSNMPNLINLNVSHNNLTGSIPDFSNLSSLELLSLSDNQLTNTIPNFINTSNLTSLEVCPNHLFGQIPNFENCPQLNIEDIDFNCVQNVKVKGTIFQDENQDCIFNEDENTIPQGTILVNDGETYAFSDTNGEYTIGLDIGTYTISYLPPNQLWQQSCLNELETYTITINSLEDTIENINFANEAVFDCALMNVNINTPLQRRCFTNNYTVQYCNEGTEIAQDAYVEVYFEEEIIVLDASIPYTVDDEIYTFELGDVGIGQCGSFTVTDSISCEAVLGSAVCAMAYIYPDDHCREISDEWDGSDIEVSAACLGDVVRFSIANNGEAMADSSSYRMYEDDVLSAILNFRIADDEVLELDFPASGVTYRLVAEQRPGHPSKAYSQAVIELCGTLPFSLGFVTSQSMANTESFFATHCEEIIGSYDPNDKLVTPKGIGDEHFIEANTDLEYKIRFQNTGNDTAFRVIIVDTLDVAHLDMSTFEALNSSHEYSLEIVDGEILRFTFDDILLVDSNANEPESHGFVSFKIAQMLDNEIGTVIENQAYIFFDYNQPILTPLAFSTIWEEPPFLQTSIFEAENSLVNIYPNPANEHFFLDFSEIKQNIEKAKIEIYDVFGRLVLAQKVNRNLNKIDISDIENGVYVYKIVGKNAILGSGKIMVQ